MAYVSQEKKAALAASVKKVIPPGWKYSLSVRHHSTIVLTIWSAPVDLLGEIQRGNDKLAERRGEPSYPVGDHAHINDYHLDCQFDESLATFEALKAALNEGNWNRDDSQTDYFDRGWYVDIYLGRWDRPFKYLAPQKEAA